MYKGTNPFSALNWQLLSPWTKTVQVVKYWFGFWWYTGIKGNGKQLTQAERHLQYIRNAENNYNLTGKSLLHNQFGTLNAYSQICKESAQEGYTPEVPYSDLVGSWFLWIAILLILLKIIDKKM